jgi:hypothetical protein
MIAMTETKKMKRVLSEEGLRAIESDAVLFGEVAQELGVMPVSLPPMIQRKSRRLTEYKVVQLVAKRTGIKPEQLVKIA